LAILALLAAAIVLTVAVPAGRWRATLIWRKARGSLKEVSWGEFLHMLNPKSGYYLRPILTEGRSLAGAIRNPFDEPADLDEGKKTFRVRCAPCHGQDGIGDKGPPLNQASYKHGNADWAVYRIIQQGINGTGMPTNADLKERQIWQIIGYLRQRQKETQGHENQALAARPPIDVTDAELLAPNNHLDEWLSYSRNFNGQRFSPLKELTRANVSKLRLHWVNQLTSNDQVIEATPIVARGTMFVAEPGTGVVALDAATGELVWRFSRDLPVNLALCCGRVNRGVALYGNTVFVGTLDGYLVAINATDGTRRWVIRLGDATDGYSVTGAPLAVGNLVIVGVGGGEFGIRGFLVAYSVETGQEIWRFNAVPGPGEPGHQTWAGDSWKTGGGGTWVTGVYDPELDLLYWGVGNPSPVYTGETREGDNLYTDSVIALERKTGKLAWHFQFTPHDEHDWDSGQTPILLDATVAGKPRKVIAWANRNGFYYLLDRQTGEFLQATPFVKQTWARGLDPRGRPILTDDQRPTHTGTLVYPGVSGGTNWQPPAYHPELGLVIVPATDGSSVFTNSPPERHEPFVLAAASGAATADERTVVKALDALTGAQKWEYRPPHGHGPPGKSGLLATAGGLVFGAAEGQLYALDARTGADLWHVSLGGVTAAAPISVNVDGHQVIVVGAGRAMFVFGL
jgi:alcohol dehydrogenase (cytochrome c)